MSFQDVGCAPRNLDVFRKTKFLGVYTEQRERARNDKTQRFESRSNRKSKIEIQK